MRNLLELDTLIVIVTFVGALATLLAIGIPFLGRDQRGARLRAVARRREELSVEQRQRMAQQRARRKPQAHVTLMRNLLEKVRLENLIASRELRQMLAAAGYRQHSAVVIYLFARLAAAAAVAIVALFFAVIQRKYVINPLGYTAISGVAAVIGFYLPQVLVKNATTKRQQQIAAVYPDALDLLLICVQSGLSVEAAFSRVTEELAEASPILAQEFGLVSAELAFLGDRVKAYGNFAERTGLPQVKALATALSQSDRYGTPVGVALKVQAQESRDDRMARAERKAGALPAQLTVPMIVFFLPVLFMVIIGPAIIRMVNM